MCRGSIRPQVLEAENLRLHREDLEWFDDYKREFKPVPCPGCGLDAHVHAFTKDCFDHMRCPHCKTVYISPRPPRVRLMEFYSRAKSIRHWNECLFPQTEGVRSVEIFKPRALRLMDFIKGYGGHTDLLVDVGAGFGTFCKTIEEHGLFKEIIALEPSEDLARTCREKGIRTVQASIEDAALHDVSVFTCFELLEHIHDPRQALIKMHDALVDRGLLYLTTPNIEGYDLMVLGKSSINIGGPNHLQFFSRLGMNHLLHATGFEVLEMSTPGKYDVENVRRAVKEGIVQVDPFTFELVIESTEEVRSAFQQFLQRTGLSSHMDVLARKVKYRG